MPLDTSKGVLFIFSLHGQRFGARSVGFAYHGVMVSEGILPMVLSSNIDADQALKFPVAPNVLLGLYLTSLV